MDSNSSQGQKLGSRKIKLPTTGIWLLLFFIELLAIFFLWPLSEKEKEQNYSSVLTASDGSLLAAHIADDGQWRFPTADSIPHKFATALRLFEDEQLCVVYNFFSQHVGTMTPGKKYVDLFVRMRCWLL